MNNISLIGRLTKDVELKYTPDGKAVTRCSVAVNDGYGEKQIVSFIDIQLWGKTAENVAQYCKKGDRIGITGSIRQDRWEDKEGGKRSRVYINASRVEFLGTKKKEDKAEEAEPEQNELGWDE